MTNSEKVAIVKEVTKADVEKLILETYEAGEMIEDDLWVDLRDDWSLELCNGNGHGKGVNHIDNCGYPAMRTLQFASNCTTEQCIEALGKISRETWLEFLTGDEDEPMCGFRVEPRYSIDDGRTWKVGGWQTSRNTWLADLESAKVTADAIIETLNDDRKMAVVIDEETDEIVYSACSNARA